MTMNRLKKVVTSQTVNIISSSSCQSQQAQRQLSSNFQGKGQNNGGNSKWWLSAASATAATAAVLAYKLSQEREK